MKKFLIWKFFAELMQTIFNFPAKEIECKCFNCEQVCVMTPTMDEQRIACDKRVKKWMKTNKNKEIWLAVERLL